MNMAAEDPLNISMVSYHLRKSLGTDAQSHFINGVEAGRGRGMVHEQDDRLVSLR